MSDKPVVSDSAPIEQVILLVRDQKVILDRDLAVLYGVATGSLNRAVKRNLDRFPADFMIQLTHEEAEASRCQIGILKRGHNIKYLPYAFTEHGAIMAATVLNSPKAVEMSVFVVRAFIKLREQLLATAELAKRLAEVEKELLTHDSALRDLYQKIRPLLLPPPPPGRKPIGFGVKEARAAYRAKRTSS